MYFVRGEVVKSDSSVEQRVCFVRGLQRRSRASLKGRSFEGSTGLGGGFVRGEVVKSDSSIEQRVYFVRGLQRRSRASIKGRLFEDSIGFGGGSKVYFVRGEDC